jgi:hypothetical protein
MAKPTGIPFQYEIEDRLKKIGWKTISEQSYLDDVEKKPRPIDIVATQEVPRFKARGTQLALVIETKHISDQSGVYMRDNPMDTTSYMRDGYWSRDFETAFNGFHHLTAPQVARHIPGSELYGAVCQSVKALLYLRTKPLLNQAGLFYPVVVYKGGKIADQNGTVHKNLLYYQTYEWVNPETSEISSRALYVDIIHESALEDYIENVYKKEFATLMNVIFFHQRMAENNRERFRRDQERNSGM